MLHFLCDIIIISKEHNEAEPRAGALVFACRRASFADKKLMRPSGRFLFAEVRYYCREKAHAEAGAFLRGIPHRLKRYSGSYSGGIFFKNG
jgi:hypothetical protein|nr:MAG TPA: hypothetical protein [Caudoviricetes sp.]